jgi:acyl-CoA reductase-like NAD-dependent aldehyde dehydrogenase
MAFLKHANALYIDGEWVAASAFEAVLNPATEEIIAEAPVGSSDHVLAAIGAAREAFDKGPWPRLSQGERQTKLTQFLDAIDRRKNDLIHLIVAEAGSTQMLANYLQFGIPMQHARHMVAISSRPAITPLPVETTPAANGSITLGAGVISREPAGVVTCITPYNFPFFLNIGKIIPALAVGCTAVLKPSPYTPLEALILGEIADEVGLPRGVLNIVTGDLDAGMLLTTDERVDLISFTGDDPGAGCADPQALPDGAGWKIRHDCAGRCRHPTGSSGRTWWLHYTCRAGLCAPHPPSRA